MKYALKIFYTASSMLLILLLQLCVSYMAPFPVNKLNLIFSILIIAMLLGQSSSIVWLSFALHFFIELYSATPFGIILFSGTITFLILYWTSRTLLTNQTFLAALGLSTIGIIIYRLLYSVILITCSLLNESVKFMAKEFAIIYAWELITTVVITMLFYAFAHSIIARFNRRVSSH